MRNAILLPTPIRSTEDDVITAEDIEIWARVERALSGKDMACRYRHLPPRKARH